MGESFPLTGGVLLFKLDAPVQFSARCFGSVVSFRGPQEGDGRGALPHLDRPVGPIGRPSCPSIVRYTPPARAGVDDANGDHRVRRHDERPLRQRVGADRRRRPPAAPGGGSARRPKGLYAVDPVGFETMTPSARTPPPCARRGRRGKSRSARGPPCSTPHRSKPERDGPTGSGHGDVSEGGGLRGTLRRAPRRPRDRLGARQAREEPSTPTFDPSTGVDAGRNRAMERSVPSPSHDEDEIDAACEAVPGDSLATAESRGAVGVRTDLDAPLAERRVHGGGESEGRLRGALAGEAHPRNRPACGRPERRLPGDPFILSL